MAANTWGEAFRVTTLARVMVLLWVRLLMVALLVWN